MKPNDTLDADPVQALAARLLRLEADQAVRNVLARYMQLCDQPCDDTAFPRLADLFTEDALWEGVGRNTAATFGSHRGRAAIAAFLQGYLAPSTHFLRNLHFLTSAHIVVDEHATAARGQWLMLQVSTYGDGSGRPEAISARLDVDFRPAADGRWLISRFRTERLERAPWNTAAGAVQ